MTLQKVMGPEAVSNTISIVGFVNIYSFVDVLTFHLRSSLPFTCKNQLVEEGTFLYHLKSKNCDFIVFAAFLFYQFSATHSC